MPSLTRMLGPIPLVQLPRKVRLELWDAPLSRHLGLFTALVSFLGLLVDFSLVGAVVAYTETLLFNGHLKF